MKSKRFKILMDGSEDEQLAAQIQAFKCSWCGKDDCGLKRCPRKGMFFRRVWENIKTAYFIASILLFVPNPRKKLPAWWVEEWDRKNG